VAAELFFDNFCQLFVPKSRCDRLCRLCSVSFSFVIKLLDDVGTCKVYRVLLRCLLELLVLIKM